VHGSPEILEDGEGGVFSFHDVEDARLRAASVASILHAVLSGPAELAGSS
jgi:hypothetical protein